ERPALPGPLVADHMGRSVGLPGLRPASEIPDVEPADRSRELRSQCEVPSTLVLERVQLADDRRARFRGEQVEALERGGADLAESERFGELDEPRFDEAALRHVLGTPVVGPAGPFAHWRRPRRGGARMNVFWAGRSSGGPSCYRSTAMRCPIRRWKPS